MDNRVKITLKNQVVVKVENNIETEQYKPAKIKAGDVITPEFYALLAMNPHRFEINQAK